MANISSKIVIGDDTDNPILVFESKDNTIISIDTDSSVSLVGEELYIDQFTTSVDYYVWVPYIINPADLVEELGPYSGDVVSFEATYAGSVTDGEITIEPVQDLNGYDRPWAPGCGKNLFDVSTVIEGKYINENGVISDSSVSRYSDLIPVVAGETYTFSGTQTIDETNDKRFHVYANGIWKGQILLERISMGSFSVTLTIPEGCNGLRISEFLSDADVMLELGSTATTYAPYSNICPISGFTELNIYSSQTQNAQDATVYTINLGNVVYGATYDIESGALTVTDINMSSYAGETLPGAWISDRDVYTPGTSPTIGAQVVYKLFSPFNVYLTPQKIQTYAGSNNIWANTGTIINLEVGAIYEVCEAFVSSNGYILCSRQNYDVRLLPYGTKITYYEEGIVAGVFYVKNVERINKSFYKINAISAIGLLDKQYHKGGIYTGERFPEIIADILGDDYNYIIDGIVAVQQVFGWLPYDTKRNNLYQLLLAYGVEIILGDNGALFFTFPEAEKATEISASRVFSGGTITYDEPASTVEIYEHSYHYDPNVDEVVLFDNSSDEAVYSAFVKFDEPIYPSTIYCESGSLTIETYDTNYAIITGSGILKGTPYVHNVRIITKENENAQTEKVVSVQDATLISFINSDNVLARLSEYYFRTYTVNQDIVIQNEKPGHLYTTKNAFGEVITGYITRMTKSISSFARATCRFIQNYTPTGLGQTYTERVVIPLGENESDTWTIPQEVFEKEIPLIRIALIGRGRDGEPGQKGENGNSSMGYQVGTGGAGGEGGKGGIGGNILIVTILATGLTELTFYNIGRNSVMTSSLYNYSSADGAPNNYGYFDIMTGELLAYPGKDGAAGAAGGDGDVYTHSDVTEPTSTPGGDVIYKNELYSGGNVSSRHIYSGGELGVTASLRVYVSSAGGGGASPGGDGGDGWGAERTFHGHGHGGDGGEPVPPDLPDPMYGNGGNGGNGSAGGGCGCMREWYNYDYSKVIASDYIQGGWPARPSDGTPGNYGCAIIYY